MRSRIILLLPVALALVSCQRDARTIMEQTIMQCAQVEQGSYAMTEYMKYMSETDTVQTRYRCDFRTLAQDTIYGAAFHYQVYRDTAYAGDVLYTGDEFVTYFTNDSSGRIMSTARWASDIKDYSHNYTLYEPFLSAKHRPLPELEELQDSSYIIEYAGRETVNGFDCHHIKMMVIPEHDSTAMFQTLRNEVHLWINTEDYLPVQYTIAFDLLMQGDTMYQFEKFVLSEYAVNAELDTHQLSLSSIPSYIMLNEYVPYQRPDPLPIDTIAPGWTLTSMNDETMSLSDFRGNVIVADFFYKACYPCLLALPALQSLHEKYQDRGLSMIGIDPYDTREDGIADFLARRGVTYTVLLGAKEVAKQYRVSGYPTVYVIDRNGRVAHHQVGYGEGTEAELEAVILELL